MLHWWLHSSDAAAGTCPIVVTRTYTVTDACGNFSTYNQTINVDDTTPPAITGLFRYLQLKVVLLSGPGRQ